MSRRVQTLAFGGVAAILLVGCATAPVSGPVTRFDDTSYGLTRANRYAGRGPLEASPAWRNLSLAGESTVPPEVTAEDPVTSAGGRPYSWQAESPMGARPKRGRYFLSGFVAGFMARMAYGAYQGAGGQGVSGGDFASAVVIGALTGVATYGFSFRLAPSQLAKTSTEQEMPRLEESSLYRDWTTNRR